MGIDAMQRSADVLALSRYLWFVNPTARTLESHTLDSGRWVRTGAWKDSDRVRAEPFDAIEIELSELWAR